MKISIFGALLILISSVFATTGQTADFDVLTPSEDIQGLSVLAEEQPIPVPSKETPKEISYLFRADKEIHRLRKEAYSH